MRIEGWSPGVITAIVESNAMDRLEQAGELVAAKARSMFPLGEPPSMPNRKTKKPWKSMSRGELLKSIRVVRLHGDPKNNIRVYAGNRKKGGPFYAHMIEYGTVKLGARPFLRPSLNSFKADILNIVQNGAGTSASSAADWKPGQALSDHAAAYRAAHGL